jgi:hypothetical protein
MLAFGVKTRGAVLKISQIDNSRSVRQREAMLRPKWQLSQNLSWAETAKVMAEADEDWSEWDATLADGLQ